jgi:arylsulfatase A-like enzyme
LGAGLGALLFAADLTGAAFAIGFLFDPRIESFYLVALAGLSSTVVGAVAGAAVALVWPARWWPRLTRRRAGIGLAVTAVTVASIGFGGRVGRRPVAPGPRPQVTAGRPAPVLWVVIDTLRADTVYGDAIDFPLAPNLRALAADSLVFSDAESAAGWTIPSMATLLTGLHPTALEAARFLPDWAPTVAERLHAAGYETRAVVDNALLERRNGFAAGFETFAQRSGLRFALSLPGFRVMGAWARRKLREQWPTYYSGAGPVTDRAIERLADRHEAPLFLYVHYMDPHYPYYEHSELGAEPAGVEPVSLPWKMLRQQGGTLRPGQLAFLRWRYAGEVRTVDRELGRLLDAWHAAFGRDGLVMITADHGEEFLDHGSLGHGASLYPELVRVPLLLHLPAAVLDHGGRRIDHPVGLVDLLPTTLDALGVEPRDRDGSVQMHGQSWLPWLRNGADAPARPLVAKQSFRGKKIIRYREGRWVRIHTSEEVTGGQTTALFDKQSDPTEQLDVGAAHAVEMKRLAAGLGWLVGATRPGGERGDSDARGNEETLRALGYIQ